MLLAILGDSPTSHSRSYQLPMLMPCWCRVSGVPPGRECSEKLWRVGSNGCKAVLTRNWGEYLRVVGTHSDG